MVADEGLGVGLGQPLGLLAASEPSEHCRLSAGSEMPLRPMGRLLHSSARMCNLYSVTKMAAAASTVQPTFKRRAITRSHLIRKENSCEKCF